MSYPSWPTTEENRRCVAPDYAAFRDWLVKFIDIHSEPGPFSHLDFRCLDDIDPVVLWVMVQEAGKYTKQQERQDEA